MLLYSLKILVKTIKPQTHIGFILLVTLLSLLSLSIVGYIDSLYNLYQEIVSVDDNSILISSYAISPFTSIISKKQILDKISDLRDVSVEFILLTPAYVFGRIVILRSLSDNSTTTNTSCVYPGAGVARELNLREGDVIPVYSIFTRKSILVSVCGLYNHSDYHSYEILASEDLVRIVRGVNKDQYSIAIIRVSDPSEKHLILSRLGVDIEKISLLKRVIIMISYTGSNYTSLVSNALSEVYLGRLGFHKDHMLLLAYSIVSLTLLSTPLIGSHITRVSREFIEILRSQGVSRENIVISYLTLALLYISISILLSNLILQTLLIRLDIVRFLGYVIVPKTDLVETLIILLIESILILFGVFLSVKEE
ncbi:MAG: hypothetical protein ABWJ42_03165 [Sulfolobales archaeon]